MKKLIPLSCLLVGLWLVARPGAAQDAAADRGKAYELYDEKRFAEAADAFQAYLQKNPDDAQATLDFAALLSQLNRHAEAATLLEALHLKNPQNEAAYFKLGVEYVTLKRPAEAEQVFAALEKSANADLATAATETLQRLRADVAREARLKAEQSVFALASQLRHQEVIDAVGDLDKQGPLSFAMAMQRLYAWHSLQQYAPALDRANQLAETYPKATDLALLRAELFAQLGRRREAVALWQQVERDHAGTPEAAQAGKRLQAAAVWDEEERIYELARARKPREVVAAVDQLEQKGTVSFAMEMERLRAWQNLLEHKLALRRANELAARFPAMSELALLRADLLTQQGQWPAAEKILQMLSRDNAETPVAFEADKRLRAEAARRQKNRVEEHIFSLARQQKHREVVAAIGELEKKGKLPWILEMQRLYSWQALGENARALERADRLAADTPRALDLALLRSRLLAQVGRQEEAVNLLKQIEKENPGTPIAAEAAKQLIAVTSPPPEPTAADRVYELANRQQHREVIAAIDDLEKQGPLALPLALQRLYALQALGDKARAAKEAEQLAAANPQSTDLAILRGDLLIGEHRWEEASMVLKQVKADNPGTAIAAEAQRRLQAIPPIANLDKWYWGETYDSGDYHGRYGAVIGSGFLRHGYFIPGARWLQPYGEMRYTVDTHSGVGFQRSIVADNYLGLSLGARAQLFPTEYLFLYASYGLNKDLLDRRHGGAWSEDFQAGLYGFKSWGPGTVLHSAAPGEDISTTGNVPAAPATIDHQPDGKETRSSLFFWRGDWFTDAGADFSYYHRYTSWIGYGQGHEGWRLCQIGPHAAIDAYAVENVSWDARGNYFDNLIEVGPGARVLWVPRKGWEVILRAEYLNGLYFGRDTRHSRGNAPGQYDDFHVGLSVGGRW